MSSPERLVIESKARGFKWERKFFLDIEKAILDGFRIADNDDRRDASHRMFRGRIGRVVLYREISEENSKENDDTIVETPELESSEEDKDVPVETPVVEKTDDTLDSTVEFELTDVTNEAPEAPEGFETKSDEVITNNDEEEKQNESEKQEDTSESVAPKKRRGRPRKSKK